MSVSRARRTVRAVCLAAAVSGLTAGVAPAGFAAARSATLTCTGVSTLVVDPVAVGQSGIGGTASNTYKCTSPADPATVLLGNTTQKLQPQVPSCGNPPGGDPVESQVITWSDGRTSTLTSTVTSVTSPQDINSVTVPLLVEEGTVTDGAFSGEHYSRVIVDPAVCDGLTGAVQTIATPVILVIG